MERKIIPFSPSKPLHNNHTVLLNAHKLLIFFLSSLLLLPHPLAAEMTSLDYPDFKNFSGICLQGNASIEGTGAIKLSVKASDDQSVGLAYYCQPIHLWNATTRELANFTTSFVFGVSDIIANLGGGITFFLSEDPTIPPGSRGDGLGLVKEPYVMAPDNKRFVAIEFDSWSNSWDLDSSCHMGIDINSLESVASAAMLGNSFRPGPQGKAQAAYNSISKNLSVSLDYNRTLYELSYIVDLRTHLPQSVYVGFSLTTDLSHDVKNITSWSFRYTDLDAPKEPPPEPPSPVGHPYFGANNSINSNENDGRSGKKKKIGILVAVIVIPLWVFLATGIICFLFFKSKIARKRDQNVGEKNSVGPQNEGGSAEEFQVVDPPPQHFNQNVAVDDEFEDAGLHHIPFKDLAAATNNFHESRRLNRGASGGVYRGFLKDLKREAAIKRIKEYSKEGKKEFIAEMKTIRRLRHRNLVELIGCCHEGRELLLVYDFMPNGNLEHHLFDHEGRALSWPRRRNIALGVASGLQYLHEGLDKCIVHRDIKPSNIMLDGNFTAKLGDFGLARIAEHGSSLQWTLNAGTVGYMAPERIISGKASKETDVYSFGIVTLELASGRRAVEPKEKGRETLIHWMWELYQKGMLINAVDKKLGTAFDKSEAKQLMMVGLWCAHPEARIRPSLRHVISALNSEIVVPDLKMNPSSMAHLPYMLVSGQSSSTKPTDDWRSRNDRKGNKPPVANFVGSSS